MQASSILARISSWVMRTSRHRLNVVLVVALCMVSAGLVTAARVAPAPLAAPDDSLRFHFNLVNPGTLCVGRDTPLKATMLVDMEKTNGDQTVKFEDRVVPGITIESKIDNPSIATISPPKKSTGLLSNDFLINPQFKDANGLGEVVFTLHPLKAGLTELHLNATIPPSLTGAASQTISIGGAIEVQNCKYKITVSSRWSRSYPGLVTTLTETTTGEITRDDVTGLWKGTANVNWDMRSFSPMCSHSHSITLGQANLTADQSDSNTVITIKYDPFELVTVNCASGSTGQIDGPTLQVAVPSEGGTTTGRAFPFPVGNEVLNGKSIITVVPIPMH